MGNCCCFVNQCQPIGCPSVQNKIGEAVNEVPANITNARSTNLSNYNTNYALTNKLPRFNLILTFVIHSVTLFFFCCMKTKNADKGVKTSLFSQSNRQHSNYCGFTEWKGGQGGLAHLLGKVVRWGRIMRLHHYLEQHDATFGVERLLHAYQG